MIARHYSKPMGLYIAKIMATYKHNTQHSKVLYSFLIAKISQPVMSSSEKLHPSAFGNDFVWGTASSAYQYEGASDKYGKGPSIWDTFTHKWPGRIGDGSNGTTAVDFCHRYKEDVQIMKKMGFNAFRLSISWSRILPSGKISGGKNEEGIQFYHDLIDELLSNGITPFVTLFHWDLPQALESEYKGFLSTQIVGDFCDYANLCFWEYGGKVKNWITLNEPASYCCGGYVDGGLAPGRGSASSTPLNSSSVPLLPSANSPTEAHDVLTGIHQPRFQATEPAGNGGSLGEGNPGTEPYTVARNQPLAHPAAVKPYKDKFQVKNGITLNEPAPYCIGGYVDDTVAPGQGRASSLTPPNSSSTNSPAEGHEIFTGIHLPRCQATEPAGNGGSSENGNPGTEPYIVARNQLLAHAAAVKLYKENFQDFQKGHIGIVLVSNWFLPWDANSEEDEVAVRRALDFMLGWFMDPLIRGVYPGNMIDYVAKDRLPSLRVKDCPEIKGKYDFIGINYYTAQYVRNSTKPPGPKPSYKTDQKLETTYHNKKGVPIGEQSGADWLYIYPKGIGEVLKWVAKTYVEAKNSGHDNCCVKDLVIYITENGVAEKDDFKKTIKDALVYKDASGGDMRTNYHSDHLQVLNNAMTDITKKYCVKIKGYFAWSLLDNYEWAGGYKTRFGLMYVDYKDGHLARYPKESATWFANFLKEDGQREQED